MNVDWLAQLPAPARRALYFGLQAAVGSRIGPVWREFLAWERFPTDQLNVAVQQRLSVLLQHATTHSEYYRGLGLVRRAGENGADWLRRFPSLSREQVRASFPVLVSDDLRSQITSPEAVSPRLYDWVIVKTGGSTGVPTTVVHDARGRDWGRATRLYAARQCGFPLGTPYFRLWGSENDLLNQQVSLPLRVMSRLLAEVPMNAFRSKEADLRRHLELMRDRPQIRNLMAYVDAAAGLAEFALERKLDCPKLDTVMACAGTVTHEDRERLEKAFGARVFDKYGSRECCDMACECSAHSGLHVFSPNVYVEVVDPNLAPCPPGVSGRLLITLLNNLSFPMIRYEIGDLGTWAPPVPCACGCAWPRLSALQGREDDMLLTEDGTWQSSVFVRHFVGVALNRQLIREWQLEQVSRNGFIFRYCAQAKEGLEENLQKLEAAFKLVFGPTAQIKTVPVSEIPASPSGKLRWVINSFRRRTSSI